MTTNTSMPEENEFQGSALTAAPTPLDSLKNRLDELPITTEAGAQLISSDGAPVLAGGLKDALVSDVVDIAQVELAKQIPVELAKELQGAAMVEETAAGAKETQAAIQELRPQLEGYVEALIDAKFRPTVNPEVTDAADALRALTSWQAVSNKIDSAQSFILEMGAEPLASKDPLERAGAAMAIHGHFHNFNFSEPRFTEGLKGDSLNLIQAIDQESRSLTKGLDSIVDSHSKFEAAVASYIANPDKGVGSIEQFAANETKFPELAKSALDLAELARTGASPTVIGNQAIEAFKQHIEPELTAQATGVVNNLVGDKMLSHLETVAEKSNADFQRWQGYVTSGNLANEAEPLKQLARVSEVASVLNQQDLLSATGYNSKDGPSGALIKEAAAQGITPKLLDAAHKELQSLESQAGRDPGSITKEGTLQALVLRERSLNENPQAAAAFDKDMKDPQRFIQVEREASRSQEKAELAKPAIEKPAVEAPSKAPVQAQAAFERERER